MNTKNLFVAVLLAVLPAFTGASVVVPQKIADRCWDLKQKWSVQQTFIWVKNSPVFTRTSPAHIEIDAGDEVKVDVEVATKENCGNIQINNLMWAVYDLRETNTWLQDVLTDTNETADLLGGERILGSVHAYSVVSPPSQIYYNYGDGVVQGLTNVNIATQTVRAGIVRRFSFRWKASNLVPSGTRFYISIGDLTWTDVTTGETVFNEDMPEGQLMTEVVVR